MNKECSVGWNTEFVVEQFNKTWYHGEYQEHRSDILFHREESRLQEAMGLIDFLRDVIQYRDKVYEDQSQTLIDIRKKKLRIQRRIDYLYEKMVSLRRKFEGTDVTSTEEHQKMSAESNELEQQLHAVEDVLRFIYRTKSSADDVLRRAKAVVWGRSPEGDEEAIRRIVYEGAENTTTIADKKKKEAKIFIKKCPAENCQGMLSSNYNCGICETWSCAKCHEIKKGGEHDPDHVCNPETVKTVELMKRDSKPCPNCASMIHRFEGCPQMWCTQCQVSFNWNTGRIENGPVHNPHYFEWIRTRQGGQGADNRGQVRACGQELDGSNFYALIRNFVNKNELLQQQEDLVRTIRDIHHYRGITIRNIQTELSKGPEIPRLKIDKTDVNYQLIPIWYNYSQRWYHLDAETQLVPENDPTRRLRLLYLLGKVNKEEMKKSLQRYEKKRIMIQSKLQIYELFVDAGTDILIKLQDEMTKALPISYQDKVKEMIKEKIKEADEENKMLLSYFRIQLEKHVRYHGSYSY